MSTLTHASPNFYKNVQGACMCTSLAQEHLMHAGALQEYLTHLSTALVHLLLTSARKGY